MTNMVETWCHS